MTDSWHNEVDTLEHKYTHVKAKTSTMTLKAKQSTSMGESSPACPLNIHNFKFKWSNVLRQTDNKLRKLL